MAESKGTAKIRPIDKAAIHRICSGQVVLDLATAVKELVENSLDAGATNIEIRLKEYGAALIEVADNGSGVSPENFQALTLKYNTSKISEFSDLQTLSSFGFRGEALSSICALSNVTVTTRTKEETVGTRLEYDYSGVILSQDNVARAVGTTVAITKLFSPLPVRYKEFIRNIRREYGRLLSVLQAYALIAKGVRLVCTNQVGKSGRSTVLQTQGSSSVKDNIITVFGSKTAACLEPLDLSVSDGCRVEGFVSKPGAGCGRASGDRQFFYINGRPVDLSKISRLFNELYKSFNSMQYPMAVLNIILPTSAYDVNVTPDKRKVFLHMENAFLVALREALDRVYAPDKYTFMLNKVETGPVKELPANPGLCVVDEEKSKKSSSPTIEADSVESLGESPQSDEGKMEDIEPIKNRRALDTRPFSMPGQEIRSGLPAKSPALDLLSFQCEGAIKASLPRVGMVSSGGGHLAVAARPHSKNGFSSCEPSKIVQSRLTGFISRSKRTREEEREDALTKDEETGNKEAVMIRSRLENTSPLSEVESSAFKTKTDRVFCCAERIEIGSSPPSSEPTLVREELEEDTAVCIDHQEPPTLKCCTYSEKARGSLGDVSKHTELEDEEATLSPEKETSDYASQAIPHGGQRMPEIRKFAQIPSNSQEDVSVVQFDLEKLRQKSNRSLLHCGDERLHAANRGRPSKRMRGFTAATLAADGMSKGEMEKEAALAAATKELERTFNKADFKHMKVLGQFNLGFILARLNEDLFIIDQHASDEKFNFERLSKTTVLNRQPLLRPMLVELSAAEEVIVSTHLHTFRQNGFDFVEDNEAPPGQRLRLSAVPFSKNITFGIGDVQELVALLANEPAPIPVESAMRGASPSSGLVLNGKETHNSTDGGTQLTISVRPSRVRAMLASRACRSSIMIGDALSKKEMERVLCHLADLDSPWNCPHGRPTMRHLADLSSIHKL